jgi:hypothetical protein
MIHHTPGEHANHYTTTDDVGIPGPLCTRPTWSTTLQTSTLTITPPMYKEHHNIWCWNFRSWLSFGFYLGGGRLSCLWSYGIWFSIYLLFDCLSMLLRVVSLIPLYGEVYWMKLYLIKFVNDLRQISCFLPLLELVSSSNKTDLQDITAIL